MQTILALDLGEKTGWALRTPEAMQAGVWNLKPGRDDGAGMRWRLLTRNLNAIAASHDIDHVAFEEVRAHYMARAGQMYGGYLSTLTHWCEDQIALGATFTYEGVSPQTIKEFATGKRNASKEEMRRAAEQKWRTRVKDDNEADARWLAEYVASLELNGG
jgi:hypothetical protein